MKIRQALRQELKDYFGWFLFMVYLLFHPARLDQAARPLPAAPAWLPTHAAAVLHHLAARGLRRGSGVCTWRAAVLRAG